MDIFDGRYEQEKLLGQGAFSEVWKVKDTQTGVTLALKIYNPTAGDGNDGNEMLTHEFALMVNASHKNLLRPLFFASCDNRPYLILPYCEKGNIGRMIGKMTEDEAWKLLRDCASALAYLHEMKPPILHQDIKPANILLSDNGDYMLTDFGVSTQVKQSLSRVSNQDMALFSAGTISYMAPERFSRNNLPVMANDIYSLGSTVYEMLSGFLPFGNDGGLLQKKGAEVPELQGDFSPLLKKTLEDCLQAEPWDRPTAEELEEIANKAIRQPESRQEVPQTEPKSKPEPNLKATTMQIPKEYLDAAAQGGKSQQNFANATVKGSSPSGINNSMGNSLGNSYPPQQPKSNKTLYAIIAAVVVVVLAGGLFLLRGPKEESPRQEVVVDTDSLLRVAEATEYEACTRLFAQENADSVTSALHRMTALAEKGNKEAVHEVAYTYAWIVSDPESARRKKLLGWNIDDNGIPTAPEINKQAMDWLNKSIEVSDGTDYKALYWLAFYYLNGTSVKRDFKKAKELLSKASQQAGEAGDTAAKQSIDEIINSIN